MKNRNDVKLVAGFMGLGIGQSLLQQVLSNGERGIHLALIVSGVVFIGMGILCLGQLLKRLVAHDRQRVIKILGIGILSWLLISVMIGVIGQLIYDYTAITYTQIKASIWLISTGAQLLVKLVGSYALLASYKQFPFSWKDKVLHKMVGCGVLVWGMIGGLSYLNIPLLAPIYSVLESVLLLGCIYRGSLVLVDK